ncbi:glycosyltransferase family 2 protein [Chelatococcus reniformis]|uniref:Bactoprenol glucosyl transferase n=1 Tax=Chelatococcus reniformis TaxID=1494448 RepID=A0A916UIC4_9HYPH|nr:glycosyltransferase family 2 protein [Chelatococcus reniformis]GGC73794.1 bactoprenol glucosyl transferase [Chelatococcus reniformis]
MSQFKPTPPLRSVAAARAAGESRTRPDVELSVVVPVYNEQSNIAPLLARLRPVLERLAAHYEIIFVNDGSRDETVVAIRAERAADPRIGLLSFSRNFGKEIAIAAGLEHARGRAVVLMDADLQHPPELIADFVAKWHEGYQMVFAERSDRAADAPARRWLARAFYRLFSALGEVTLPVGAGDFRLIDRAAADALGTMGERARFSKGLYAWVGFSSVGVPYTVAERESGSSKFNLRRLVHFALDGITSFSTAPLRVSTYFGLIISAASIASAAFFLIRTMLFGTDLPGYPSLIVSIMFFSGIQLLSLGVIGEYIGRIFAEVKGRPLYILAESLEPRIQADMGSGEPPAPPHPADHPLSNSR